MESVTAVRAPNRAVARRFLVSAVVVGVLFSAAYARPVSQLDTSGRFLLLATQRTGTMEEELAEAGAAGYRIITGSPTSGTEMVLLLEKVATPPAVYEYRLLATTRTGTMQRELEEAVARGFRLLPETMMSKSARFGSDQIVVVLEKAPNSPDIYEYLLLATDRTSTMQREITTAIGNGFAVVGMASRGEHVVILERLAQ